MASSQDTEITLGTGKLLVLFFGLVVICALFFGLGYSLGRKSDSFTAGAVNPSQPAGNANKASGGSATTNPPQMSFYKAVEQKTASAELAPAADAKPDTASDAANTAGETPSTSNGVDPATMVPTSGYFVQVAAVSKQDDAQALVEALKKKEYPAFVAPTVATDKLFRVQLGPFSDVKEAEAMRTKLIADGYSPILKK
jgi:DedD protein